MKTATEIQLEALAMAYDSLRLYTEDMEHYEYESDTKREWVGLTDHEIACLWGHANWGNTEYVKAFGRELESKLKEKNT